MVVETRPAQPIRRLAAPSSASTNDSALSSASSETATISSFADELLGDGLSAAMLPPERFLLSPGLTGPLDCGRIHAGLADRGKGPSADFRMIATVSDAVGDIRASGRRQCINK